jgi:hypothetical protein
MTSEAIQCKSRTSEKVKQARWLTHLHCDAAENSAKCDEKPASNVGAVPSAIRAVARATRRQRHRQRCSDASSAARLQISFDCWRQDHGAVANDLVVHLPSMFERTDTEIAQAAGAALKRNTTDEQC